MTAVAEPRTVVASATAGRAALDRLLAARPRITWDLVALSLIVLAGFLLRFYDLGARAMHHDESLHATFSWYFYRGQGYEHDPLMHGPFLFHAMALTYALFGVTDATARFVPAFFGSALVALPWLLRGRLGRAGALAAALLLAVSPVLLYFSRFVGAGAQDIVLAVTALLMTAAIWRYLDDGRARWLYLLVGALCISFATKEVTFIIAVIFLVWLNGLAAHEFAVQRGHGAVRRALLTVALFPVAWLLGAAWPLLRSVAAQLGMPRLPRSAELLLVMGLFTAPQFAAGVQVPLQDQALLSRLHLQALHSNMASASSISGVTNEALVGGLTVGLLLATTTLAGIAWRRRTFLICMAIFWGIYILLFTTFFTNLRGLSTGIWGSLDYWLAQHGEERGRQPVFYYAMLTPVYEYLTLVLAALGVAGASIAGRWWSRASLAAWVSRLALLTCVGAMLTAVAFGRGDAHAVRYVLVALLAMTVALRRDRFRSFLAFWAGAIFFALSVSGEKMPWLEVHIALPLILLAALTIDEAIRPIVRLLGDAGRRRPAGAAAVGIAALAAIVAAGALLWPDVNGSRIPIVVTALAIAGLAALTAGWRSRSAPWPAVIVAILALLLPLSVRDALRTAFVNGDTPRDMLVYTQTTPRLKQMAEQVDEFARTSGLGANLPITVDSTEAFTWPWAWYLRDYRNVLYLNLGNLISNPVRAKNYRPPAVLFAQVANTDAAALWPGLQGRGERFPHRWWFPEKYRGTTARGFWDDLRDRGSWEAWGEFFLHRRLTPQIGSIDSVAYFNTDVASGER